MKKLILSLCVMMLSVSAFAQKGKSAVGLNLNVTPLNESGISLTNFGVEAKYQYNLTNPFRVEAVVGYDFKAKGTSVLEAGVNVNWLFNIGSKFKVYPIAGVGYANISGYISKDDDDDYGRSRSVYNWDDDDDYSNSASKFYFNLGAGAEYAITQHIAACLEVKYQSMTWFNRIPISIGVAYKF